MLATPSLLLLGLASRPDVPPAPEGLTQEAVDTLQNPLAAEEEVKLHDWSGAINLGIFSSLGNTERSSINFGADAQYRRERDRTTLNAYWNWAEEESLNQLTLMEEKNTTENRYGAAGKYDYFLTEKSYLLANLAAERDTKADIDVRATGGLGYGYQFVETEELKFNTEAGVNWFYEEYYPNEFDLAPAVKSHPAARLAYHLDYSPIEKFKFLQGLTLFPSLEDKDDVYGKLVTDLRYTLTEALFAQFQWVWDYNNTPAAGKERNDHRFYLTLGYTF